MKIYFMAFAYPYPIFSQAQKTTWRVGYPKSFNSSRTCYL